MKRERERERKWKWKRKQEWVCKWEREKIEVQQVTALESVEK